MIKQSIIDDVCYNLRRAAAVEEVLDKPKKASLLLEAVELIRALEVNVPDDRIVND